MWDFGPRRSDHGRHPREAANDVIDELRGLGLQDEGAIQITGVPTWISRHALQAEQDAPGGIGHRGLGGSDPEGLRGQ